MQHPEITQIERTGYPSWLQEDEDSNYCCECGMELTEDDDIYTCSTHNTLCLDCLKMLHRK